VRRQGERTHPSPEEERKKRRPGRGQPKGRKKRTGTSASPKRGLTAKGSEEGGLSFIREGDFGRGRKESADCPFLPAKEKKKASAP